MTIFNAALQCIVEVYPYEGGQYTIKGTTGLLRAASVSKTVEGVGRFSLQLAPGGPFGPHLRPLWSDIITPMSLVVIAMRRGTYARIVMIGIVSTIQEGEVRAPNASPQRGIVVQGEDFQVLYSMNSYFTLNYLGATEGIGAVGSLGLPSIISSSLVNTATPAVLGAAWFERIMAGPKAIMEKTTFAYKDDRVTFYNFMAKAYEDYPIKLSIPGGSNFVGDEENWLAKFRSFFQSPWFEFIVTTADVGYYTDVTNAATPFSVEGFNDASPTMIARVNPLPYTQNTSADPLNPTFTMDMSRWDALPIATLDGHGGVQSTMAFSSDDMKNYYVINPRTILGQTGGSNSSLSPFALEFAAWVDPAAIHRYGYRPLIQETIWFIDDSGQHAVASATQGNAEQNRQKLVGDLILRIASMHEPTPLMAYGSTTFLLRPDIMPGQRFNYVPFRDGVDWDFYVNSVSHEFVFGGMSTTTLQLSRGLPSTVYADQDLLIAIHTGNAIRREGQYLNEPAVAGEKGLQPLNQTTMKELLGQLAQVFVTPQGH